MPACTCACMPAWSRAVVAHSQQHVLHCRGGMCSQQVVAGAATALHAPTRVCACAQIDIVVVSCSCFAPTPSMAAMLVNHFKLRRDVLTYNLSGMGCSSSLISIDLVKHLLKVGSSPCCYWAASPHREEARLRTCGGVGLRVCHACCMLMLRP